MAGIVGIISTVVIGTLFVAYLVWAAVKSGKNMKNNKCTGCGCGCSAQEKAKRGH